MIPLDKLIRAAVTALLTMLLTISSLSPLFAAPEILPTDESDTTNVIDPIDLHVDENQDGIPDELATALAEIDVAYRALVALDEHAPADKRDEARQNMERLESRFMERLPYRAQTRQAQARMRDIYQAVTETTDHEELAALRRERNLQLAIMLEDPNFALVDHILTRELEDALNAKVLEDATEEAVVAEPREETDGNREVASTAAVPESSRLHIPFLSAQELNSTDENDVAVTPAAVEGGAVSYIATFWESLERDPCLNTGSTSWKTNLARTNLLFYAGNNPFNNFFFAKKYSHVGMVSSVNSSNINASLIYEANPGSGVMLRQIQQGGWLADEGCVARASVSGPTYTQESNALSWAQGQYGTNGSTGYNYILWEKDSTTNGLYCSQLVYKAYKSSPYFSLNLDSNHSAYHNWFLNRYGLLSIFQIDVGSFADAAVAPDEIALHPSVVIHTERHN